MNASAFHVDRNEKGSFVGHAVPKCLDLRAEFANLIGSFDVSCEENHATDIIFDDEVGFVFLKSRALKTDDDLLSDRVLQSSTLLKEHPISARGGAHLQRHRSQD